MKRRTFWGLGIVLLVLIAASALYAGWLCEIEGGKKGTVGKPNSQIMDMGDVLFTDIDSGATTHVAWPTTYEHYDGPTLKDTWTRSQLSTPHGNFVLKMGLKLSGRKSWGSWSSKRNRVQVDVHIGNAQGNLISTITVDKNVGSPSMTYISLPDITPGFTASGTRSYTIVLRYDKWDGNSSNDNGCGSTFTVKAD